MPYSVFNADVITFLLQFFDRRRQRLPVFFHNRIRYHVKTVRFHIIHGFIPQNFKGRTIDAYNTRTVQRMAQNAAVHCHEYCFQRAVLLHDFLRIGMLSCHIDSDADRSHNASVTVIQRRFISHQRSQAVPCHNDFFRDSGFLFFHNHAFGFDTGRIILLHVPYVCVPLSLHLLFGFIDGLTEAVVYLLVYAVLIFVPDQIGYIVNRRFKVLAFLPEIHAFLVFLLPLPETEPYFPLRHGHSPQVSDFIHAVLMLRLLK